MDAVGVKGFILKRLSRGQHVDKRDPRGLECLIESVDVQHVVGLQGQRWEDDTWDLLWDHALLWRFLQEWLDLLAAIPESLLVASSDQLEKVWLDPVAQALSRRLG